MFGMLYAHWLDGEWHKIAYPISAEGPTQTLRGIAEGALKLHALFGTRIAISDIQLTDSPVLVSMFGNAHFRDYLRTDSKFLTLVAQPRPDTPDRRLAFATRGLARASQPGWTTSLPGVSVDVIRRFADPLLGAAAADTGRWIRDRSQGPSRVIAQFPEHGELLTGMLFGICHFARASGGPVQVPVVEPRPYTHFIEDALKGRGLQPEEHGALESVLKAINKWVPDVAQRSARSSLIKAMETKEPNRNSWPPEWHETWNTAVHAWNANVSDTLGATGTSIAPLPGAVVPFRGRISDVAGPFNEDDGILRPRSGRGFPVLRLDPSNIGWSQVSRIVGDVRAERARFQKALASGSLMAMEEPAAKLIEALQSRLFTQANPVLPWWVSVSVSVPLSGVLEHRLSTLGAVAAMDQVQARVRSRMKLVSILNTLREFRSDLISGLRTSV